MFLNLNYTILIVEDDDMSFRYLEVVLKKKTNLNILRASDGQMAIDMARKHPDIQLILMDIQLPVLNGYEAINEIKKFSDVPIIAQTANAMSEDRIRCMDSGCTAFITKPVNMDTLLGTISETLEKIAV